jgi:hypothetical protein
VADDCEVEAKVGAVEIQNCNGDRILGLTKGTERLSSPIQFDAIPLGIEEFWSDTCQCDIWQVTGIAGAHTRIALFLRQEGPGLALLPGGEFASEIGKISRVSQGSGFIVEVRDSDVSGKHRTLKRYRFDGKKFSRTK